MMIGLLNNATIYHICALSVLNCRVWKRLIFKSLWICKIFCTTL